MRNLKSLSWLARARLWPTLLLVLASLELSCAADFTQMKLDAIDPKALCNDGSPGMLYFRPGTGSGAKKWVLRLEGGGWCSDLTSCAQRQTATPALVTSRPNPPTLAGAGVAGVLSADPAANPAMYNWNHVSITYCSSDSFLGDAGPDDTPQAGTFQFRGKRILVAAVRSLMAGQNFTLATDVLVSGESAGGVAAMNNAGAIQDLLTPRARALRNFKCLVDAGWFLDIPSYSTAVGAWTFRDNAMKLQANWNASFDGACTAHYGADQAWLCFFAQYAWPYVTVPLLFHQFLYDTASLSFDSASTPDQFSDYRAKLTQTLLTPASDIVLPRNVSAPATVAASQSFLATPTELPAAFAPAETAHTLIDNLAFSTDRIGGAVFTQVLDDWFTGRTTEVSIVDPSAAPHRRHRRLMTATPSRSQ